MCIQLLDNTPEPQLPKKTTKVLVEAKEPPALPAFITPTPRYELERQRHIEAELGARAAERYLEVTHWAHLDAAWCLVEDQVAEPLENLVEACGVHREETGEDLLPEEELEELSELALQARTFRISKVWPRWHKEEAEALEGIRRRHRLALETRPRERRHRRGDDPSALDYTPVIEALKGREAAG